MNCIQTTKTRRAVAKQYPTARGLMERGATSHITVYNPRLWIVPCAGEPRLIFDKIFETETESILAPALNKLWGLIYAHKKAAQAFLLRRPHLPKN